MEFPYHHADYRNIRETKAIHSITAKQDSNIPISQFLLQNCLVALLLYILKYVENPEE